MKHFLLWLMVLCWGPVGLLRADDWPQFLGPRRDGTSLEKGLVAALGPKGAPLLWQRDVGEGYSGPVIADGRLILFHRIGAEEIVECLNAGSGKQIWKFAYASGYSDSLGKGDGPRSTPIIQGDKVITLGAEGTLHSLSLADGKKIWERSLTKEYKTPLGYFGVGTSPVIEQNLLLINVGGPKAGNVAFQLADGKEAWKATDDPPSYSSPTVCTVDGARLAVFFTRTGAVVLDPKTGAVRYQQRWRARMDASVNAATPLVIGNQAFFSTSYETGALLLKLRKDGAEEVWNDDTILSNHYNTSVYHDGHLYGFDGRQEAGPVMRCVELKSRKVKWEMKLENRSGCGSMILADGRLILVTEKGNLHLIEATPVEFRETGRAAILESGPCMAHIALANGRLYARDQKKLVCVDLKR